MLFGHGHIRNHRLTPKPIIQPFLGPASVQPQPFVGVPSIQPQRFPEPFPGFGVGWCHNKWATMCLGDGRTINMFVTTIEAKSLGGFVFTGYGLIQLALDLDEIGNAVCSVNI